MRKCLDSWETRNPGWDFRCLDAGTIARYIELDAHVDLRQQTLTAASLSDILRLLLLHEYGGVWVDATTYCNVPLDEWLPLAAYTGFFAFSRPADDRDLASWFLAALPGNALLAKWTARSLDYWHGRRSTQDYFWVHHQFGELCAIDGDALRAWQDTPRISADGPHAIQRVGLYEDYDATKAAIDWTAPVFKLTHRLQPDRLHADCLVSRVLGLTNEGSSDTSADVSTSAPPCPPIGLLKVGTENLGDHIQIIAGEALLRRAGLKPSFFVDRDDGIAHPPPLDKEEKAAVLLNGWFKTNSAEWPPHRRYIPIYLGFHARPFQAPSLVSEAALDHYAANAPIGCRDRFTLSLIRSHGVEAFLSHCLSLTFPRRLADPESQTEIFVVSRDRRILDYLPASLGRCTFSSHYSGDRDFVRNKARAAEILETYRARAKLIVTTMLHCALPAIAMGIPVVVFLPLNEGAARQSDLERFSSLSELVRVFTLAETSLVDWRGYTPNVSLLKLRLVEAFFSMVVKWGHPEPPRFDGFAPSDALPVPSPDTPYDYFKDPERFRRLALAKSPDRQKWGASSSYNPDWAARGALAARHIRDGTKVLEIGTGKGSFRDLVAGRCRYTGADLQPLDDTTLALDIEKDPIPPGSWDTIVLLGVIEYLYDPLAAMRKVCAAAETVVLSYCVPRGIGPHPQRRLRGWTNAWLTQDVAGAMHAAGFALKVQEDVNASDDFEQMLFVFAR